VNFKQAEQKLKIKEKQKITLSSVDN